ncbi:MAG: AmmeMemoRadiSam system protein B [Candidatus Omnitrophica bacterium]|nr:AmmeMemoRadiSam system protein B [Candidatus Omnitrophota bacterium]
MRKIFIAVFLIFLFSCTSSSSEEVRKPAVAGAFYPGDKDVLEDTIATFLNNAERLDINGRIIAVMAPHAGYVYSGQVAAYSFKQLDGRDIDSVVIMCSSHTARFSGIAIDDSDTWQTPLGSVALDRKLADRLTGFDKGIAYNKKVHERDHTLEVELPFLQTVLKKDFKIVPLLFGNMDENSYKILAQALSRHLGENGTIVISTDMSHYPRYDDANSIDQKTLEIIKELDVYKLEEHLDKIESLGISGEQTLCCGIDGVKTVIELCNILGGCKAEVLKYANSGDVAIGDKSRVVGYGSMVFYIPERKEEKGEIIMKDEYLNKEEKKKLMKIAKASIIESVTGKKGFYPEVTEERLKENCGAFVTIKKHGQLRGCIGYIIAVKPLHETVKDVARSAAINDHRFSPMTEEELKDMEIEISALTPLKRIDDVNEIEVGKHGLYMKRGFYSGILLPQVATEYGWDRETFLKHTCQKAGLPVTAWKDDSTEIYIYSAEVFGEEDVK